MATPEVRIPGPDHPITVEPAGARLVARVGDHVLADSAAVLTLREASYPPVQYFPAAGAHFDLLRRSDTTTHCPYKGDASYYDVVLPTGALADAVWVYEHPHDAVSPIAGHLAFYADRVTIEPGG